MSRDFFPQRPDTNPKIYAYEDTNPQYAGLLKVGYITVDVQTRVKQQYPTLRPGDLPYKIVLEISAMRNDGTYLMGRTAMVTKADTKIVIQSHIRRIKVLQKDKLSPYLLLALLGLEIVQKQIESKSFRQGTISTLGSRISEVKIPIPVDEKIKSDIVENVCEIIKNKQNAKLYAQEYKLMDKTENLMGIKNKAKIGNL